ncbi:MAG: pentapeptide repeat-containing protein [Myxococcota bacterium]
MANPSIEQLLAKGARAFSAARAAGRLPVDHTGATFTRLFFARADLSKLVLVGSEWEDCHLGAVDFSGADLSNAYVHGGRFERCSFRGANLTGATFEAVDLVGCDFTDALGLDALEYADARLEDVRGLVGGDTTPAPGGEAEAHFIPGKVATHPDFEAALDAHPDDEGRWEVYGDWLQTQGDLRGELVARHGKPGFDDFVQAHVEEIFRDAADEARGGGQMPELTVEWRHGFVHAATLRADNPERKVDLGVLAAKVLSLPVSRFLRGLHFGVKHGAVTYGGAENEYSSVIEALKAHPRTPALQHLSLGLQRVWRDDYDTSPLHHWGDLSALWALVPGLKTLYLKGGGGTLGALVLPELERFTLEADYLGDGAEGVFDELRAAKWPKLRRLEVTDVGGELNVPSLLATLESLPLVHLAIQESGGLSRVLEALLQSKVLPRLEVLDLRLGVLDGRALQLLQTRTSAFRHLRVLDLTGSVSEESAPQVEALGSFIRLDNPLEREVEEDDGSEPNPDDSGEYEVWADDAGSDEEGDGKASEEPLLPVDAELDIPDEHGDE